jgi:hypothetical protein
MEKMELSLGQNGSIRIELPQVLILKGTVLII